MQTLVCGHVTLQYKNGYLSAFYDDMPLFLKPQLLFIADLEGCGEYLPLEMEEACTRDTVNGRELLSVTFKKDILSVRVDFLLDGNEIRVSHTLRADWQDGIPAQSFLRLPWLAAFRMPDSTERYPAKIFGKASGSAALQMKKLCPPPYCIENDQGEGIAAYFPLDAANLSWDPCRNFELCDMASRADMENCRLHLRLSSSPVMASDICLWPLENGWRECFERFCACIRQKVPDTQYQRADLQWMRDVSLMHFSYAFGREFFDYEKGAPDIEKLLDEGEKFGGYDAILLWHEYPRLGLDARTQWDFYADYPGGMAQLKHIVAAAHRRGVRVFLPFKPWDRSPDENDTQTTRRIAKLIGELQLDGVFFDTMNTVPEAFRSGIDDVRRGVVFMTESEPHETRALEMITSSWNQYRTERSMPESNLMRFLFPAHTRCAISRWHVGAQKDTAIERAVFNGEGMVIWQDVFGAWLPYSEEQKEKISAWKRLKKEYQSILDTQDCVPLMTACAPKIAANGFFAGDRAVITLYLDDDAPYEGDILRRLPYTKASDVRGHRVMQMQNGTLSGALAPHTTAFVVLE